MPQLFEPLTIRQTTLKNRIVVSPMCMYSSEDGFANDWHLVHLGSRAVGGAALVIAEATGVAPEGRISPGCLGLWKDGHIPALKRITDFIHAQGGLAGIQLAHAGRKASCDLPWKGYKSLPDSEGGWTPVAPSAIAFSPNSKEPVALDVAGIQGVIRSFQQAARRSLEAGMDVVEIHAAHGYLLNEFLSPISNLRQDEYGGTFENRTRLLKQVVAAVRQVWPLENPLFVRLSCTDWATEGPSWSIEDSVKLATELKLLGVDLIDCSSGGTLANAKILTGWGYQTPFAEQIRREAGILTGAVGLITTADQAEGILQAGKADVVLLARQFLQDPYFALHAAAELKARQHWPRQYGGAKD